VLIVGGTPKCSILYFAAFSPEYSKRDGHPVEKLYAHCVAVMELIVGAVHKAGENNARSS
jgi:hypothetical protein